jgi:hypothetical protein
MENYQCHITINNRTDSKLIVQQSRLDYGHFMDKKSPAPIDKKAQQFAFAAQGSSPGIYGTEGEVVYKFETDANCTLTIYFDVPTRPGSDNTLKVKTSDVDIVAEVDGFKGSGSTEVCTIKLVDGR